MEKKITKYPRAYYFTVLSALVRMNTTRIRTRPVRNRTGTPPLVSPTKIPFRFIHKLKKKPKNARATLLAVLPTYIIISLRSTITGRSSQRSRPARYSLNGRPY